MLPLARGSTLKSKRVDTRTWHVKNYCTSAKFASVAARKYPQFGKKNSVKLLNATAAEMLIGVIDWHADGTLPGAASVLGIPLQEKAITLCNQWHRSVQDINVRVIKKKKRKDRRPEASTTSYSPFPVRAFMASFSAVLS